MKLKNKISFSGLPSQNDIGYVFFKKRHFFQKVALFACLNKLIAEHYQYKI